MTTIIEIHDPDNSQEVVLSKSASAPEIRAAIRQLGKRLAQSTRGLLAEWAASIDTVLCVVILRGGMMLFPGFSAIFDDADYCIVGISRDSETSLPRCQYVTQIPRSSYDWIIYLDCIAATGNTILETRRIVQKHCRPGYEIVGVISSAKVATAALQTAGLAVVGFSLYESLEGALVMPDLGERDAGDLFSTV